MTPVGHVVYLHGFASSPESSKASRFAHELAARGIGCSRPDLNLPAFETLTITRMIEQTHKAIAAAALGPVALVGASLGGFVALHAAARDRHARVDRLILLAPALDFGGNRLTQLGSHGIEEWRRTGSIEVDHYGYGETRRVDYALYEDAGAYDAFDITLSLPMLVVQGRQDPLVDPASVQRWAATRSNVDLRMVDDGHQLSASIDLIWRESERWLEI